MLKDFGGRVADTMGIVGNAQVASAAALCASAVIPAIKAILAGDPPPVAQSVQPHPRQPPYSPHRHTSPRRLDLKVRQAPRSRW